MQEVIRFGGVTKRFGEKIILENVSISVNKGEIFGIVGLSGCGKTTLLNLIIGFTEPEKGNIGYYSEKQGKLLSISKIRDELRRTYGFATQFASFYPKLTVEENLVHFGSLYNLPKNILKSNSKHLLELTDLEYAKNTLAQDISGGMKKRLSLACSLMHKPKVLILDEPTSDLDPLARQETWEIINGVNKIGTTVIVASHFLDEMESYCDRVAMLHDRSIVSVGKPKEIVKKYFENEEIHVIIQSGNYDKLSKIIKQGSNNEIQDISVRDNHLIISTTDSESAVHHLLHVIDRMDEKLVQLNVSKASLNEVFESLNRGK